MALITLSPEQIEEYRKILMMYIPYSEEEVINIEFDSKDYDFYRLRAYMAQKALREAGLLDEE